MKVFYEDGVNVTYHKGKGLWLKHISLEFTEEEVRKLEELREDSELWCKVIGRAVRL